MRRPLVFFGGKGGVGKTTLAAAAALESAREGTSTLLVSTDPAHSTSDVLGARLGPEATEVATNLWAMELDPSVEAECYMAGVKERIADATSPRLAAEVERQLDVARASPGAEEAAPDDAARLTIPDGFDAKLRRGEKVVLQFAAAGEGMARDLELLRVRRAAYTVLADVIAAKRLSGEVNRESVQAIAKMSPSLTLNVEAAGQRQTVPNGFEHAIPGELVMFTMLVMVTSGSMLVPS